MSRVASGPARRAPRRVGPGGRRRGGRRSPPADALGPASCRAARCSAIAPAPPGRLRFAAGGRPRWPRRRHRGRGVSGVERSMASLSMCGASPRTMAAMKSPRYSYAWPTWSTMTPTGRGSPPSVSGAAAHCSPVHDRANCTMRSRAAAIACAASDGVASPIRCAALSAKGGRPDRKLRPGKRIPPRRR
jgi:hypothetical protein